MNPGGQRRYPSGWWVMLGLLAGAALGLAARSGAPVLVWLVETVEPIGIVFVNAIRMTVVPLVVSMLIAAIGSMSDRSALARLAGRSLVVGLTLAFVVAAFAMVLAVPILGNLPIDPSAVESLRAAAAGSADAAVPAAPRGIAGWFVDLVPANVTRAAADGAMLPLIVFALLFGLAMSRVPAERRAPVTGFFTGLADGMLVLVGWIIMAAPLGVFGLAAPLGARLGADLAGALVGYVALAVGLTALALALIVYPVTAVLGGVTLGRFARAVLPAQAVALSSRSTMATLPAMMDAATGLGVPPRAVALVVPLAAATLRVGSAVGQTVAVLFAARLFGVDLSAGQYLSVLVTTVLTTFTVPGIPGGSIVVMVPILAAAGVPAGAVAVLLGVDVIPDMLRTTANVTGGIAAAVLVGREEVPPVR